MSTIPPLVHNVAGRAMNGHPDAEDIVRENLRAGGDLTDLMRRIDHWRRSARSGGPAPGPDFEEIAVQRLGLTGEQRQVAEAARWLDDGDRTVLALWWPEAAGHLTRAEVATAMDTGIGYATEAVQRMRTRLDRCRSMVAALAADPRCPVLADAVNGWDGRPGPVWGQRIDRHVGGCRTCLSRLRGETPVDRVLAGIGLVPVAASTTTSAPAAPIPGSGPAASGSAGSGSVGSGPAGSGSTASRAAGSGSTGSVPVGSGSAVVRRGRGVKALVAAVAVVVASVGGVAAYAAMSQRPQPAAAPAVAATVSPVAPSQRPSSPGSPSQRPSSPGCAWPGRNTGTVRDEAACLEWQRTAAPATAAFAGAKAYCAALTLGGGGWRLPTRAELTAADRTAFPATPAGLFWTSAAATPATAWAVDSATGKAREIARAGRQHTRCVRQERPISARSSAPASATSPAVHSSAGPATVISAIA